MPIKITFDDGSSETTDTGGNQFTEYCQGILRNGYYLNANHTIWIPPSKIERIEIIQS